MKRYVIALQYLSRHKYDHGDIRNLRLGAIVSLYGIAFAVEKVVIHDWLWAIVYGIFAFVSTIFWIEDAILDLWEDHTNEDKLL